MFLNALYLGPYLIKLYLLVVHVSIAYMPFSSIFFDACKGLF